MHHMKKASIRDLRYRFAAVEELLKEGEEIQITKRRRVIARLLPAKPKRRPRRPDFLARLKRLYGGRTMPITTAELLAEDRDRF